MSKDIKTTNTNECNEEVALDQENGKPNDKQMTELIPSFVIGGLSLLPSSPQLMKKIIAFKRVSKFAYDENTLEKWLNTVDYINSLERDAIRVNEQFTIDKYIMPKELKGLILPNSVTITGVSTDKDYLIRPVVKAGYAEEILDREDFNNVSTAIASAIYKDSNRTESISKSDVKFEGVYNKECTNKGFVKEANDTYFPIPVDVLMKKESAYNYDARTLVLDHISDQFKNK